MKIIFWIILLFIIIQIVKHYLYGIKVLPEYEEVYKNLTDPNRPNITFVTGGAGTGKSFLIKWLKTKFTQEEMALLAPTGIAAITIGGVTIHSFCKFGPQVIDFNLFKNNQNYINRYKDELETKANQIKYVIIDEISMVRCDLLDCINEFFQFFTKNKEPFGGKKVLFVGDFYQLPPVVNKTEEPILIKLSYSKPYKAFNSKFWNKVSVKEIELKQNFRQKDKQFYNMLTKVRFHENSQNIIDYFNNNCNCKDLKFPYLVFTNKSAETLNNLELNKIKGREYSFIGTVTGNYDKNNFPALNKLVLKIGARVMIKRNASDRSYVNGSIGKVIDIVNLRNSDTVIKIRLENDKIVNIRKEKWEQYDYVFDANNKICKLKSIGSYTQFPLALAWATTIHKSQGLTLSSMTLYKDGRRPFASGQIYVALSRCRTIKDIAFDSQLLPEDIF